MSTPLIPDELFGLRESIGASLIGSAGVVEVLRQQAIGNSGIVEHGTSP
jgi:hypothetical protein